MTNRSVCNVAVACAAVLVGTSASQGVTFFSEDFADEFALPGPNLTQSSGTAADFTTVADAALFPGFNLSDRSYLRTNDADYNNDSFVAEITVNLAGGFDEGSAFFGLGAGEPDFGFNSEPRLGSHIYLRIFPSDIGGDITVVDNGIDGMPAGGAGGNGTHRLQMRYSATSGLMQFGIQQGYGGGAFSPSTVFDLINVADNGFSGTDARIFFGGSSGAGTGMFFDDLSVAALAGSTISWVGGAGLDWSTPGNWAGSVVPGLGDTVDFGAPTNPADTSVELGGNRAVNDVQFTASNTYNVDAVIGVNTLTLESGSLSVATGGDHTINSNIDLLAFGTWQVDGDLTVAGDLSTASGMLKTGNGQLTLTGSNGGISGDVSLSGGTLVLSGPDTVPDSATIVMQPTTNLNVNSPEVIGGLQNFDGTVSLNADLTVGAINQAMNLTGDTSGGGQLILTGNGDVFLTGDANHTGLTTVGPGRTLKVGSGGTIGSITGNIDLMGQLVFDRSDNSVYGGVISGNGFVTKQGGGNLTLSNANTYVGPVDINAGKIVLDNDNALQNALITINTPNGLDITTNAVNATVGGIQGNQPLNIGAQTLTVGNNGEASNFAGVISGTGNINKIGGGSAFLNAANTYSGGTTLKEGTLGLQHNNAAGTGTITVSSFATLSEDFSSGAGDFSLNGSAAVDAGSVRLTQALANQTGSAVSQDLAGVALEAFEASFDFRIGGGSGADGMSFSLLDASAYDNTALFGEDGPGADSLTVSFDVFQNAGEPVANFVEVIHNGVSLGTATPTFSLENNVLHNAVVSFEDGLLNLTVTPEAGSDEQLFTNLAVPGYAPSSLRVGYGARTGGQTHEHRFDDVSFVADMGVVAPTLDYSNGVTISNAIDLQSDVKLNVFSGAATQSGTITNGAFLDEGFEVTKTGAGTLTLSGTNTYSGGTTIADGVLSITSDNNLGASGSLVTFEGGTLHVDATLISGFRSYVGTPTGDLRFDVGNGLNANLIDTATLSGDADLIITGGGVLNVQAASTYLGATLIQGGTLDVSGVSERLPDTTPVVITGGELRLFSGITETIGSLAGSGNVRFSAPNTHLRVGMNNTNTTFGGNISLQGSGDGQLTKLGTGALSLTGAGAYTGGTTIDGGALQIGDGGTTGSILGDVTNNAALIFNRSDDVTFPGAISGTGSLTKLGAGVLNLTATNTYSGGTTLADGTLSLTHNNAAGTGPVTATGVSTTIDYADTIDIANAVVLQNDASLNVDTGTATQSGVITQLGGGFGFTKTGAGSLVLGERNFHSGDSIINAGTIILDDNLAFESSTVVLNVDNGLDVTTNTINAFLAGLEGPGDLNIGNQTLNVFPDGTNTYAGDLTGSGGGTLNKVGGGTFILTGNASGLGTVIVNNGTLVFDTGLSTVGNVANGAGHIMIVRNGATLQPTGSYTQMFGSSLLVESSASFNPNTVSADSSNITVQSGGSLNTTSLGLNVNVNEHLNFLVTGFDSSVIADSLTFGATGTADMFVENEAEVIVSGQTQFLTSTNSLLIDGGSFSTGTLSIAAGQTPTIGISDPDDEDCACVGDLALAASPYALTIGTNDGDSTILIPIDDAGSGPGSIVKVGTGTLSLGGSNTYSGGTKLFGGTVAVSSDANLGDPTGPLEFNGGTLRFDSTFNLATTRAVFVESSGGTIDTNSNSTAITQAITGYGGLAKSGSGLLTLLGTNTYMSGTTVSGGELQIGNGGTTGSIVGNVTNNATLTFNRSDDVLFSNVISGTGALTKDGNGTLTLTGANTYSGGTTITKGTLRIGNGGTTGSIVGNITNNADLFFNRSDDVMFPGAISGTGGLTKLGAGTLTLTGTSTYTGGTSINGGSLKVSDSANLGDASSAITFNGGKLQITTNHQTYNQPILISSGANAIIEVDPGLWGIFGGSFSGAGGLVLMGDGNFAPNGNNTYTGATSILGGRLDIIFDERLPNTTDLTITSPGVFTLDGTETIGSLAGSGNTFFVFTPGSNLRVGANNLNTTYTGNITDNSGGSGQLTKIGSGTQILTGTNTYTEGTTISGGTLQIGDGGTTGSILGDVTNNAALIFNRSDDLAFAGAISGTGGVTKLGAGMLTLTGANTYTAGTTIDGGALQIGDGGTTGSIVGNVLNHSLLIFNRSDDVTFPGVISGTGSLSKLGAGTLTLNGVNTYTGGTTINGGTLSLGNSSAIGTGDLTILGSTIDYADGINITNLMILESDVTLNVDTGTATQSGAISESGGVYGITKTGAGILGLGNSNSYTGTTHINAGQLQITTGSLQNTVVSINTTNGLALPPPGGVIILGGLTGNSDQDFGSRPVRIGTPTDLTYGGIFGGSADVTTNGPAKLTLSGVGSTMNSLTVNSGILEIDSGIVTLASTFEALDLINTGDLQITGGGRLELNFANSTSRVANGRTLSVSGGGGTVMNAHDLNLGLVMDTVVAEGADALAAASTPGHLVVSDLGNGLFTGVVTMIDSSTITVDEALLTVGGLESAVTTTQVAIKDIGSAAALTVGWNSLSSSFAGTIVDAAGGPGGIRKTGLGTFTLTGINTYTGDTIIDNGTLKAASDAALGAAGTTVEFRGGTLNYPSSTDGAGRTFESTASGDVRIEVDGGQFANLLSATSVTGPGSFIKTGDGVLNFQGEGLYGGATEVQAGTFDISGFDERIPDTSNLNISSGANVRFFSGTTETIGSLSGGGELILQSIPDTHLRVGADNSDTTFSGRIFANLGGDGQLTKIGTGKLTLEGDNTYTGHTAVDAGTLKVTLNPTTLSSLTVADGAVYDASGPNGPMVSDSGGPGLTIAPTGDVTVSGTGVITTAGGHGAAGGDFPGPRDGGHGGAGGAFSPTGGTVTLSGSAQINVHGGNGGSGFSGNPGNGGDGGTVFPAGSTTNLSGTSVINISGGHSGASPSGGSAGNGGGFFIHSGSLSLADSSKLILTGGNGESSSVNSNGGNGGEISLVGGTVTLGGNSLFDLRGGDGTLNAGSGGSLLVNGASLALNDAAFVYINGGNGLFGGTGGSGGTLTVMAGSLDIVGGGISLLGGNTAPDGIVTVTNGVLTQTGGGLNTGTFNYNMGTGSVSISNEAQFNVTGATTLSNTTNPLIINRGEFFTGTLAAAPGVPPIQISDPGLDPTGTGDASAILAESRVAIVIGTNDGDSTVDVPFTDAAAGPGTVKKMGAGTLTLAAVNIHTGGTKTSGGIIAVSADHNLGGPTAPFKFDSGTLQALASFDTLASRPINIHAKGGTLDTNFFDVTFNGLVSGDGNLTKAGLGKLTLPGTNTYSGDTLIQAGIVSIAADANLGDPAAGITLFHNAMLQVTSSHTSARNIVLNDGDTGLFEVASGQTYTHTGVISGAGGFRTISGTGILALAGNNTFTGTVDASDSTIAVDHVNALGLGGADLFLTSGGHLKVNVTTSTNRPIRVASFGQIEVADTHTFTPNAGMFGSGNFFKIGPGTLLLNETSLFGDMTHPTEFFVDEGTVLANNTIGSATGTSDAVVTVRNDATLGGTGAIDGPVTVTGPGTIAPGNSVGHLTINNSLTLSDTSTVAIEASLAGVDQLTVTGSVALDGTLQVIPVPDAGTVDDMAYGVTSFAMSFGDRGAPGFETMFDEITGTLLSTSFALAPLFNNTDTGLFLRASVPGDLNLDNKVSVADLSTFALNFGTTPGLYDESLNLNSWELGDFNADGAITVADLSLLALNFGFVGGDDAQPAIGLSLEAAAAFAGIDLSEVPEPATLTMLAAVMMIPRRRRS